MVGHLERFAALYFLFDPQAYVLEDEQQDGRQCEHDRDSEQRFGLRPVILYRDMRAEQSAQQQAGDEAGAGEYLLHESELFAAEQYQRDKHEYGDVDDHVGFRRYVTKQPL